jgi:hypothetical protein
MSRKTEGCGQRPEAERGRSAAKALSLDYS